MLTKPNNELEKKALIAFLRDARHVDEPTFLVGCGLTESTNFNAEEFDSVQALAIICYLTGTVQPIADGLKKGLFYGPEKVAKYKNMASDKAVDEIADEIRDGIQVDWDEDGAYNLTQATHTQQRLIHAALGFITEGMELLEHIIEVILAGDSDSGLDWVNIFEEKNDADWYGTIIPRAAQELADDLHDGDVTELNLNTLEPWAWRAALMRKLIGKRYPGGVFDAESQENRDTNAERKELES